jgi:hypothetical protein
VNLTLTGNGIQDESHDQAAQEPAIAQALSQNAYAILTRE